MEFKHHVRRLVTAVVILTIAVNIILLVHLPYKDTTSAQIMDKRMVKQEDKRHIFDRNIKDPQNAVKLNLKTSFKNRNDTKGRNETIQTSTPRLITVHHQKGRLGNQMFELAMILGLANTTNRTPILTSYFSELDLVFDLPPSIYSKIDTTGFEILTEDEFQFHGLEHMDSNTNWTLDGYFQFFKLFRHIENGVRNTFKFKPKFVTPPKEFIAESVPPENVKVGVHVRRGDIIFWYGWWTGRNSPGIDYFQRAMDFYRFCHKNVTFIVTSDDKLWCQKNFRSGDILFSPFNDTGSDLALLSLCDHTIMSVGTFGWWGAWLAGGSVIYYGRQFRHGSKLDRNFVKEDFYPPHWISLD